MDCCEVCGKVAMTSTRLFTTTKGKGKRRFDERKTYTNSIEVKAALV